MDMLHYAAVNEIIGQTVTDTLGNPYGKLEDIFFAPAQKNAIIAVIATEGAFKNDYFVLPFQALRINPNSQHVTVEIDKQTVQQAPDTNLDLLKKGSTEELIKIFNYYGFENTWEADTQEGEPFHNWYKSGEDTGEKHPDNEGSYETTKQYPGPKGSHTKEEADFDKIKGLPKDKK